MGTWLSSGKKSREVAAEWGISSWSLNRWHKEQGGAATPAVAPELDALELAREVGRLRRENEALTRQRDILKKAISIFSAENPNGGLK